jgi:hypothetical protein
MINQRAIPFSLGFILFSIGLITTMLGITTAQAQSQSGQTSNSLPTVDQILQKNLEAMGGFKTLENLNCAVSKGTVVLGQIPGKLPYASYFKKPGKFRLEIDIQQWGKLIHVINENRGWSVEYQGKVHEMNEEHRQVLMRTYDPLAILKLKQNYTELSVMGKQLLEKKEAWVIAGKTPSGSTELMFFDTSTCLLIGFKYEEETPNGSMETLTLYDRFKPIQGMKIPFFILQKGEDEFSITIEDIQVNGPVDEALFAKPAVQETDHH